MVIYDVRVTSNSPMTGLWSEVDTDGADVKRVCPNNKTSQNAAATAATAATAGALAAPPPGVAAPTAAAAAAAAAGGIDLITDYRFLSKLCHRPAWPSEVRASSSTVCDLCTQARAFARTRCPRRASPRRIHNASYQ